MYAEGAKCALSWQMEKKSKLDEKCRSLERQLHAADDNIKNLQAALNEKERHCNRLQADLDVARESAGGDGLVSQRVRELQDEIDRCVACEEFVASCFVFRVSSKGLLLLSSVQIAAGGRACRCGVSRIGCAVLPALYERGASLGPGRNIFVCSCCHSLEKERNTLRRTEREAQKQVGDGSLCAAECVV
jgi:hypothetical protein